MSSLKCHNQHATHPTDGTVSGRRRELTEAPPLARSDRRGSSFAPKLTSEGTCIGGNRESGCVGARRGSSRVLLREHRGLRIASCQRPRLELSL
jgi:hypothetical protein